MMTKIYYKETAMEEWIEELYCRIGIVSPESMDIHIIADRLGVEIVYEKCRPFSDGEKKVIFLSKRDSDSVSRLVFFHELCHLLRHSGDQRLMPPLFRDGQEIEADHFVMYAAIPYFMVQDLEIPERHDLALQFISDMFKVPKPFAKKRLEQIERRITQGMLDDHLSKVDPQKFDSTDDECMQDDPYILYSFYDFMDDVSGPSQLIVHVNNSLLSSLSDFEIDISGPFEQMDDEEASKYRYTSLKAADLNIRNGHILINFDVLRLKYGKLSNRFVIQMKDVEEILKYEFELANF
ncbi:MAG: ImmA/IrrE family metallo-endopeptidase [Paenibacillus sp.]|uniref:ImmA/IrrE family metallo-endopeptidase n=1 Tax=Paenibacillus sp. TaxID=58172 RepID=UPI0029115293|nr:ImmA/IrrE family metallo-endopeptidase [Paenibacillus sp.]MDU4696420.1 ImmA/IrrE family metallo-endopeptidase [Paenibacillus sp.]